MLRRAAIIKSSKFKSKSKTESSTFKSKSDSVRSPPKWTRFRLESKSRSQSYTTLERRLYVLDIRLKYSDAVSNEQSWI